MRSFFAAVAVLAAGGLCATACQTYPSELARAQTAFEQNNHEKALAVFRALEPDLDRLSVPERAQYSYLRGMTDYRIGYKADARHWLSLAKTLEEQTPGLLPGDWKGRMDDTLDEMNEDVYGGGMQSLSNAKGSAEKKPAASKPTKSEDEP